MKLFIDTANVKDIKKASDMGVICGVTTNPSLIAKEGRVFEEVIAEIARMFKITGLFLGNKCLFPLLYRKKQEWLEIH